MKSEGKISYNSYKFRPYACSVVNMMNLNPLFFNCDYTRIILLKVIKFHNLQSGKLITSLTHTYLPWPKNWRHHWGLLETYSPLSTRRFLLECLKELCLARLVKIEKKAKAAYSKNSWSSIPWDHWGQTFLIHRRTLRKVVARNLRRLLYRFGRPSS